MNVGIIVTARVNSSRLENKVLQKINGKHTIEILLDHVINNKYPVVMAITDDEEDRQLAEIAEKKGVEYKISSKHSPLHEIYDCAIENGFDYIVRITADDILIDSELMFNMIKFCINGGHEYVYMKRCVDGIAGEVIKTACLGDAIKKVGNKSVEFVSYYIKNLYKTLEYYPPFSYQYPYRLTMDYPEDLMLLRIIFSSLKDPGTLDIINFIKQHPYFLQINHMPTVTIYTCNYNTSEYIIDCIDSVLYQDFEDFEYIIVDDNSEDDSMNVIMEYYSKLPLDKQNKIKVLRNEENIGLPASCNRVLSMARGRYIIRVDSDDTIEQNCITRLSETIELEGSDGALSGYNRTDSSLNKTEEILTNEWHPACALLSKWCVNEIKYRDGIQYEEGKFFYDKWREMYKTSFVDEPLWNYRQRPGQKTGDKNHPQNRGKN